MNMSLTINVGNVMRRKIRPLPVIGLRTATPEDISKLKAKYPQGEHRTTTTSGKKLSYNGVFICNALRR